MKSLMAVIISLLLTSCSMPKIKPLPEHNGVDPRVQNYVDLYKWFGEQKGIKFENEVSIGFKDINNNEIAGMCTVGLGWREIDIDISYWNNSTKTQRLELIFHELTHCYCSRGHDYGEDLEYPKTKAERVFRALQWQISGGERPGYWEDGCPVTMMYPVVLDDECTKSHYDMYVKEMFDRCDPW